MVTTSPIGTSNLGLYLMNHLHAPWVAIAIDSALELFQPLVGYRMITFILLPTTVIALCILIGGILRIAFPKIYSLLTGGRGF